MKKLSKNQIVFLSNYMEAMDKAYKTQIYFSFADKSKGEKAFNFLKSVYADECNYSAWSGWFGLGDKRDFYLGFVSVQARDNVYNDINKAVNAYENTDQYQEDYLGTGSEDVTVTTSSGKTIFGNNTTYIVIGIALAVILLLLWDKKKK